VDHGEVSNDPVNDPVNERQKWFMEQLAGGAKAKSTDLAQCWNVSQVTAKRDIADLKDRGKIEFVGSPKNGWYRRTVPVEG
jgi:predicted HTH transcriptional regulator